jgi:hypothetical protein
MLKFTKENGYPVNLDLYFGLKTENGYENIVYVNGIRTDDFLSETEHGRALYARGFLTALGYKFN